VYEQAPVVVKELGKSILKHIKILKY
jgi:hypothetical protein